ncbi:MAG: magnesium transporter, partial [Candidatus Thorarchaeota archaeon]
MSQTDIVKKTAINLFVGMFIQAVIALSFDGGGIISGTIASFLMDTKHVKWIVLIYGPLLAARGDIAVLAGKLGTGLHLGTVKPTFRKNTPIYRSLLASVMTIAMIDAVLVGAVTYIMNLLTFPAEVKVVNPTLFFVIPIIVLGIAAIISTQITSAVSFFTYKRGLNPDIYVVPVMSTVNNILITIFYALTLMILKPWGSTLANLPEIGDFYPPASNSELLGTYIAIIPAALILAGVIYVIIKSA